MAGIFQQPAFLRLFLSNLVSQVGNKVHRIALLALVNEMYGLVWTGVVISAQLFSRVILGPLLGPLVDRNDRRLIMLYSDLVCVGLVALIPLLGIRSLGALIALTVLVAATDALRYPALNSAVADLVPESSLDQANSLLLLTNRVAEIGFVALAGLLVAGVGFAPAFYLDAFSYLISALYLLRLPALKPKPSPRRRYLTALLEGFGPLWHNRTLRYTVLSAMVAALFGSAEAVLGYVLAVKVLKIGVQGFGVMEALTAAGALLGFLWVPHITRRIARERLFLLALMAFGFIYASMGAFPYPIWVGVASFLFGVANAGFIVPMRSILQIAAPPDQRGRILGTFISLTDAAQIGGATLGATLAAMLGITEAMVFCGLAVTAVAIAVTLLGGIPEASAAPTTAKT